MKTIKNTEPTLVGKAGQAWVPDLDVICAKYPTGAAKSLTVTSWIVQAVWAHPFWQNYFIACVHLRPDTSIDIPPIIYLEGATHELFVYAINPGLEVELDDVAHLLMPANFVGQFIADSDEAAKKRVDAAVQEVLEGVLSPDTDFISQWVERFGDSCLRK